MKHLKGIRAKLLVWYMAVFVMTVAAYVGLLYYRVASFIGDTIDDVLLDELNEFKAATQLNTQKFYGFQQQIEQENFLGQEEVVFFELFDAARTPILKSSNLRDHDLVTGALAEIGSNAVHGVTPVTVKLHGELPIRVMLEEFQASDGQRYKVAVGTSLRRAQAIQEQFLSEALLVLFPIVLLSTAGGWLLASRVFKPLDSIIGKTKSINTHDFQERLPKTGSGDELDRLVDELNSMLERLQDAYSKLAQFTSDASHELRTPLAAMKTEIEVTLQSARETMDYQNTLVSLLEDVNRLTGMVEELLLLTRMDASELPEFQQTDLSPLVAGLCQDLKEVALDKGVRFADDVQSNVIIRGNAAHLRIAFANIIANAVKYTAKEGRVTVSLNAHDGTATFAVCDTGCGIAPDELCRVFDRFFRVDRVRSRQDGGHGLGLSIAKRIVELHGGDIQAKSTLGEGSEFWVKLPMENFHQRR